MRALKGQGRGKVLKSFFFFFSLLTRGNRGKVGAIGPKTLYRGNKSHRPSTGARKKRPIGR
jgi:hypothetical protein